MGKSTISMAIFNSYVSLPEGSSHELANLLIYSPGLASLWPNTNPHQSTPCGRRVWGPRFPSTWQRRVHHHPLQVVEWNGEWRCWMRPMMVGMLLQGGLFLAPSDLQLQLVLWPYSTSLNLVWMYLRNMSIAPLSGILPIGPIYKST